MLNRGSAFPSWVRPILVAGIMAGLGAVVIAQGVADLTRDSRPAVALQWAPWDAEARLSLARQQAGDGELDSAVELAREAAVSAPLESEPFRLLGQVAASRGELAASDRWMALAADRSRRDTVAQLWRFGRSYERGDFQASFEAADAILRRRPNLSEQLYPPLAEAAARSPEAETALTETLRVSPSWRESFLVWAAAEVDPQLTYRLHSGLRAAGHPPTDREMAAYIRRLVADGNYSAAHLAWLQHLPAADQLEVGLIFDGGFDRADALPPFGWTFRRAASGLAERAVVVGRDDRPSPALYVSYSSSSASHIIAEQLFVLPPGQYTLSFDARFEQGDGSRLIWSVTCVDGRELLRSQAPSTRGEPWERISGSFETPRDCGAQRLTARVAASDRSEPVAAWFDAFTIQRGASSAAGATP